MTKNILEIEHLSVEFLRDGVRTRPVRDVSLCVREGERVAIVGESGCGKSLTAMSIARLPPTDRATLHGRILFEGRDLLSLSENELRKVRGRGIAYVFQDPTASLNPVARVWRQVTETLTELSRTEKLSLCERLLDEVGLPDPPRLARAYPCEMSGGQQQRVMLAMALAQKPRLLVADEPTTALDVTTQGKVLDLIEKLSAKRGMAVLLITHNLGLVAGRMERVCVMYGGGVCESGPVHDVAKTPLHPYAQGLLAAVPRLDSPRGVPLQDIPGTVPPPDAWQEGCVFAPRCPKALAKCPRQSPPDFVEGGRTCACWLMEKGRGDVA